MKYGAYSLIVNAIYFTAKWDYTFSKGENSKEMFYSADGNKREIRSQRIALKDYRREDSKSALKAEENLLIGTARSSKASKSLKGFYEITIPKMKIETDFKLKDALIAMGLSDRFSDQANLTGITREPPLRISDAAHRAIIEVDEEGTTAAAATVFKIVAASAILAEPLKFRADHPFLFVLTKRNNPLFMGQFV
ncbi:serine proteinase inhibitor [Teladorsagia circumcincta]|uniref:Serine proteinase inhibitor n=1 Tax=Teladorsagia circumcincta TaxID=45464 RepID=A0A2G9UMU0_TELCI|nr:serine proteinase inhibitor [Teladorsagia circumcincta]